MEWTFQQITALKSGKKPQTPDSRLNGPDRSHAGCVLPQSEAPFTQTPLQLCSIQPVHSPYSCAVYNLYHRM